MTMMLALVADYVRVAAADCSVGIARVPAPAIALLYPVIWPVANPSIVLVVPFHEFLSAGFSAVPATSRFRR